MNAVARIVHSTFSVIERARIVVESIAIETPEKSTTRARDVAYVAALVVIASLTWLPRLSSPIELRWDAGVYYVLGQSLAKGEGYRLLNEPGEIEAVQYPPLVPAFIALHLLALKTSAPFVVGQWLRWTWFVLFVLVIGGCYAILRRRLPAGWAFVGGLICTLHSGIAFYAGQASAELPYTIAVLTFFTAQYFTKGLRNELLSGAAAVAAFYARTAGIAVLIVWSIEPAFRRRYRTTAGRSIVAAVAVLMWSGYVRSIESRPSFNTVYDYQRADYMFYNVSYAKNSTYIDPYRPELGRASLYTVITRVADFTLRIPLHIGRTAVAHGGFLHIVFDEMKVPAALRTLDTFFLVGLGFTISVGFGVLFLRGEWPMFLFVALTLAAVAASPWPQQSVRYLSPIVPLLLLALLMPLYRATVSRNRWWRLGGRMSAAGVVSLMVVMQATTLRVNYTHRFQPRDIQQPGGGTVCYRQFWYGAEDIALDDAIDWIAGHAHLGDVVAGGMPQWIYLRTGLKAVMPPFETSPERAQALLDSVPVRFLMNEDPIALTTHTADYMNNMIDARPADWRLVYTSAKNFVRVYERVRPAGLNTPESLR